MALSARGRNGGLHKRMMILATVLPVAASIDRMQWLPSSLPASPWTTNLWILAALLPMFVWDVVRNRRVHEAYGIWLAIFVPVAVLVTLVWDKPLWHSATHAILRV